jgi:hypothetical protein
MPFLETYKSPIIGIKVRTINIIGGCCDPPDKSVTKSGSVQNKWIINKTKVAALSPSRVFSVNE